MCTSWLESQVFVNTREGLMSRWKEEQTRYSITVMQAFLDGKEIESYAYNNCEEEGWEKDYCPQWDWNALNYRIMGDSA